MRFDEETFNYDLVQIKKTSCDISDDFNFYSQLGIPETCETLTNSYCQDQFSDILNDITFASLKILNPSLITRKVTHLQTFTGVLINVNLPLSISYSKIVFVLKIPFVEPEYYILYRLYPITLLDNRTDLKHVILANQKYFARLMILCYTLHSLT